MDNFFHRPQEAMSSHLAWGTRNFELIRHDVVDPLKLQKWTAIYNLACPASPVHYQYNPIKTAKTSAHGGDQLSGVGQESGGPHSPGLYVGGLWGSGSTHPQPEEYTEGNVNPIGSACLLRRGQAVCRNPVLRLSSGEQRGHTGGSDLQHLRSAHVG